MNFSIPAIKRCFRKDIKLKQKATNKKTTAFIAEYIINNKFTLQSSHWYMVTIATSSSSKNNNFIKLILDKKKPNEQVIDFTIYKKKSVKRLFYSARPQTISLFSNDKDLIVEELSIFRVSYFFAFTRSISKLTNNHPNYFNKKKIITLNEIRLIAKEKKDSISAVLYQKYKEITNLPPLSEAKAYSLWVSNSENNTTDKNLPTGISFLLNKFDKKVISKSSQPLLIKNYSQFSNNQFFLNPLEKNLNKKYLVVIEEGTTIAKNALQDISEIIKKNPNAELIYTDDDYINQSGERHSPHFKPDWNPDLFYSCNYIGNTYVIKSEFFYDIAYVDQYQGLSAYQVLFELIKKIDKKNIFHLPKIIFHKSEQKKLDTRKFNFNHIIYPTTRPREKISIIIPTKDKLNLLERCVSSIINKSTYKNYEIIIINNNSVEKITLDYLLKITHYPNISVINYRGAFNFSAMNNFAATRAKGQFLLLLNNDTEVITENWLDELLRYAVHPEVGCVGAKLLYSDNTIQHAGVILGINGIAGHAHRGLSDKSHGYHNRLNLVQNFSAVTAACLMVRKEIYHQAGGLTERLAISMNDVDFCLKVQELGYRNVWTPDVLLYHHESQSRGTEKNAVAKKVGNKEVGYMKRKWCYFLQNDPAYNPNLTRVSENFSINPYPADQNP